MFENTSASVSSALITTLVWGVGIETPIAQGRSSHIVSMIEWIRTSKLSVENSLSFEVWGLRCWVQGSGFVIQSAGCMV